MSIAKRNRLKPACLGEKARKRSPYQGKAGPAARARSRAPGNSVHILAGFLKLEAVNGNEVALAVLRSRKEAIEPETALEPEQSPPKAPARTE